MRIRLAGPGEADRVSALAARLFRETYTGRVPQADLEAHVTTALGAEAMAAALQAPGGAVLLAEVEGEWMAYAQLRPQAPPVPLPGATPCEIARFYVDARHHGAGLADRLMAGALAFAREGGHDPVWLQVWEESPRAIRFYLRQGFLDTGPTTYTVGSRTYVDRVMVRR